MPRAPLVSHPLVSPRVLALRLVLASVRGQRPRRPGRLETRRPLLAPLYCPAPTTTSGVGVSPIPLVTSLQSTSLKTSRASGPVRNQALGQAQGTTGKAAKAEADRVLATCLATGALATTRMPKAAALRPLPTRRTRRRPQIPTHPLRRPRLFVERSILLVALPCLLGSRVCRTVSRPWWFTRMQQRQTSGTSNGSDSSGGSIDIILTPTVGAIVIAIIGSASDARGRPTRRLPQTHTARTGLPLLPLTPGCRLRPSERCRRCD